MAFDAGENLVVVPLPGQQKRFQYHAAQEHLYRPRHPRPRASGLLQLSRALSPILSRRMGRRHGHWLQTGRQFRIPILRSGFSAIPGQNLRGYPAPFRNRRPDLVLYRSGCSGPYAITSIGDAKPFDGPNNFFTEAQIGHVVDMGMELTNNNTTTSNTISTTKT